MTNIEYKLWTAPGHRPHKTAPVVVYTSSFFVYFYPTNFHTHYFCNNKAIVTKMIKYVTELQVVNIYLKTLKNNHFFKGAAPKSPIIHK